VNPTAGYSARGSDDEYCSVYRTEGHFYVSCHVDAAPIAWVQRCSICGHVSSSDLRAQLSGGSDGYHTFGELYAHRRALTAALVAERPDLAWRSRRHHPDSDPMFEGSFIVGIDTPAGPVTYHYGLEHWDDFSAVPEVEHAPLWDGAPASASVDRLLLWARRR
jgi:hypothetical protein